jgi:hypothetical protein
VRLSARQSRTARMSCSMMQLISAGWLAGQLQTTACMHIIECAAMWVGEKAHPASWAVSKSDLPVLLLILTGSD